MEMIHSQAMGTLLDMAALTLCGFAVYYILWKRKAGVRPPSSDEQIRSIVQSTFEQWVRQQPNLAPAATRAVMSNDTGYSDRRPSSIERDALPQRREGAASRPSQPASFSKLPRPANGNERSLRIYTFAESGMSVKKISEKLDIPRCEVELIAKFQHRQSGGVAVMSGI